MVLRLNMSSYHACDACGGRRLAPIPDRDEGRCFWRCGTCDSQNSREDGECQFCECGGTGCTRASCSDPRHFVPCLVCLGAGRISDQMPIADALADAETLRLNTSVLSVPDSTRYQFSKRQWDSTLYGPWAMYELGCYLARAAFRAVPGLRERPRGDPHLSRAMRDRNP